MIPNVVENYLAGVSEREFDQPLLAMLASIGYRDIHLTHGSTEFGKDVIAKKETPNGIVQYAFQSKAGDVNQSKWNSDIQPQLIAAFTSDLSHPAFDQSLPLVVVLVMTGNLIGNARIGSQSFQNNYVPKLNSGRLEIWEGSRVREILVEHGDAALFGTALTAASHLARFYESYSLAITGNLSARKIEELAASWCNLGGSTIVAALESSILSSHLMKKGALYESVMCDLGFGARLLIGIYGADETSGLSESWQQIRGQILHKCSITIGWASRKGGSELKLHNILENDCPHTSYLIHCARFLELASLGYFLTDEQTDRATFSRFITSLINANPGTCKPLSDRYAVTIVVTTLVLLDANENEWARTLIEYVTTWLGDRYGEGIGLAPFDGSELEEVSMVLTEPYDMPSVSPSNTSFLATAIVDLAAFSADSELLDIVINDILAVEIIPGYWQVKDSRGACEVEGGDIIEYPNVELRDEIRSDKSSYAEHVRSESLSFKFSEHFGAESCLLLALLLRDRYFPGLWPVVASNHLRRVDRFDSRTMWQTEYGS